MWSPGRRALRTTAEILVTYEKLDYLHGESPWNQVLASVTPKLPRRILKIDCQARQSRRPRAAKANRTTNLSICQKVGTVGTLSPCVKGTLRSCVKVGRNPVQRENTDGEADRRVVEREHLDF